MLREDRWKAIERAGLFGVAALIGWQAAALALPAQWQQTGNTRITVYYRQADPSFVQRVMASAHATCRQLDRFRARLSPVATGKGRTRVRIYLFDSRQEYLRNTGQPDWSDGSSIQRLGAVYSFVGARSFLDRVLPHELAHIFVREQAGFDNRAVPAWLEEGFAALFERQDVAKQQAYLKEEKTKARLFGIKRLSGLKPRSIEDKDHLNRYFVESASIVRFLRDRSGPAGLGSLLEELRTSQDLDTALARVYGFKDASVLYQAWSDQL